MMSYKQRKSNVLGTDSARIRGRYLYLEGSGEGKPTLSEMRTVFRTLPAVLSWALLSACSGGSSTPDTASPQNAQAMSQYEGAAPAPVARPRWMRPPPRGTKAHLAVAQFGTTSIFWFKEADKKNAPPKTCEPASSTNGIRIDAHGNLWVPNGKADTTTEYAPDCGVAQLTVPDPDGEPGDVGFDRRGNVYILNINNTSGAPVVHVYTTSGTELRTLTDPSFSVLFGVNGDSKGNVFVSNLTSGNVGNVVEFKNGKMPGKQLSGVSLKLPGAPVFDTANNLIISDWGNHTIDVFAPPYTGSPITSQLKGSAIWCPLDHAEKHLYCGDAGHGAIDVYAYPGGSYLYSFTSGLSASELVTGVAPDPPAPD
jgi:hypothetical protein